VAVSILLFWSALALQAADDFEFFEAKIRPVLVERCYKCHSRDAEKLKGALLLDSREGMLKGGESGQPAIVPGYPEKSKLFEAISHRNPDLQMPPKEKLSDQQIQNFTAWIKIGAPDPRVSSSTPTKTATTAPRQHWSFQVPKRSPPPMVRNSHWAKTPIDRFILARLEEKGLNPAPVADKRTLIRRAFFDLIGLPPSPEQLEAFLKNKSPDAYAHLIDQLLDSPHYGERWGRYWLDVARYADTKGYVYSDREEGRFVHSYVYRDWVVRALNQDLPYDQFLKLQIAADQFPAAASSGDLAALGFLTLGQRFLGVTHDIIDDRIDVVMRGMQGLTVGCARCHDHKFDPIPTRDYYSLYGIFAGSFEKLVPVDQTRLGGADAAEFQKGLKEREDKLQKAFAARKEQVAKRVRARTTDYLVAILDVQKIPTEEFYAILGPEDLNPVISRQWHAYLVATAGAFHPIFAPWHALAELRPEQFRARAGEVLRELKTTSPHALNPIIANLFETNAPASMVEVAKRYGKLFEQINSKWLARQTNASNPALSAEEEALRQVLYATDAPTAVPDGAIVDLEWFFDEGGRVELAKLQSEIDRWIIKSSNAPAFSWILEDRPGQKNPRLFKRGNPANKGEEVPRQFLEALTGKDRRPFSRGSGRLELAEAIGSRDNPLTARVMVNRIWQHHFGAGLVRTPSDFGTRCDSPSHPELLDWLATELMQSTTRAAGRESATSLPPAWSIKHLHRLIMLSAVYQQSSSDSSERAAEQIDPENKLLSHFNRQRLDFESWRDAMLAVSGELDLSVGGRPEELFKLPVNRRRTIYGFVNRQFLPGTYRIFDFANPDMHNPQRPETTVPQQALFFMNSPFVAERARVLGRRLLDRTESDGEKIRQLYELIYQREPTASQRTAALHFVKNVSAAVLPEPLKPPPSPWQYGVGEFDEPSARVKNFDPLPHFSGAAWQGGAAYPDEILGWAQLTAEGGHAGNDLQHAVIRRWVAPTNGTVSISGSLRHTHKEGDGIRARIVSSATGVAGEWKLHNDKVDTKVESIPVKAGDTIDFLVSIAGSLNNNDFSWAPSIKFLEPMPSIMTTGTDWNAKRDFSGLPADPAKPLAAWDQLAQVLLLANEFFFVD
jgi:hypothetical protein